MSKMIVGEIDWNSGDTGGGAIKNSFMRLSEGENTVRIMGDPTQYYVHWVQVPGGPLRKINSPIDSAKLVQKLEDAGFRRQARWLIKVLDRSDNQFKLLEIGGQIYNGIRALFNNKSWGKVTNYDISITRGPKGAQPLYSLTPNPKEPLDPSFRDAYIAFNDKINIEKFIGATPVAEVCKMLNWSASEFGAPAGTESTEAASDSDDSDEFEFNFQ